MWRICLIALLALCSCSADKVTEGIPNLHQVRPGVWRGGQPNERGWHYLHDALNLTNDIKLDTEEEASDAFAQSLGMNVIYVPITLSQQMVGPVGPQLRMAVTNIIPGTYFHCEHGVNRTGTLGILDRVQHDHWTKAMAVKEAKGYDWDTSFHALKDFVEDDVK